MINEQDAPEAEVSQVKSGNNTPFKVLAVVIILVVIGLGIAYFTGFFNTASETSQSAEGSKNQGKVVARVDGVEVRQTDVDQRTRIILSGVQTTSTDITNEQLAQAQQIAFQQLVNEILILQAAQQSSISVSDQEVQTEFDRLVSSYPDEQSFQQDLVANNLTEQDVKIDIGRQLAIQKYVDQNTDSSNIQVTEDEINELYQQYSSQQEDMPELDEVRDQLQQQIFQDKLNQQVTQLIQSLQNAANIEIFN